MKVKKQGKVTTVVVDGALIWPFATQIHHEQPLGMFYVNLIGPYTLKGRDNSQIDFMALTMIDPASSWFEITELPLVKQLRTMNVNGKELLQLEDIFDRVLIE